ncbi:MAG TPA: hypothetical protein O0X97_00965 [Methanocorpusculum sp.]|nr:hypothetical protein [Methanocorpusculum sp.]
MTKTPDEIMAVHLLNGGKMLNEMCPECGAPLFEIKGRKTCVVCAETKKAEPQKKPEIKAEVLHEKDEGKITAITPSYAKDTAFGNVATPELDSLISELISRAKEEQDPSKCLTLIECIRTAAEAKTILARFT